MSNVEIPIEKTVLGEYNPSFFEMYLNFDYRGDVMNLSPKDFGTLVHEYVHYLQNITTPWGMFTSQTTYSYLSDIFAKIQRDKTVKIPVTDVLTDDRKQRRNDICRKGQGDSQFGSSFEKMHCDKTKNVRLRYDDVRDNYIFDSTILETQQTLFLQLGAHIIKESMAAMFEKLANREAEIDDYPYNIIKIIAEKHFPQHTA